MKSGASKVIVAVLCSALRSWRLFFDALQLDRLALRTSDVMIKPDVLLLLDYIKRPGGVANPWYTGDSEATWREVIKGCTYLLADKGSVISFSFRRYTLHSHCCD